MTVTEEAPVQLPFAVQFDMASKLSGRTYRIMVAKPFASAPENGHPVIVASDGNMTFPIAAMLNALFGLGGRGAVIVGVGYPTDNPLELQLLRRRDLTPPTPAEAIPAMPGWPAPDPDDFGGADAFLAFLTDELRPLIAERFQGDPADQTLYGHSLGGLFTLHALFERPDAFRAYVASSPSIWWNGRELLQREAALAARIEAGDVAPRVLITIGETESEPPAELPPGYDRETADKMVADARMVENAAELGVRLAALKGGPGYVARYRALHEDDHTTSMATSIGRTLSFALRP
jgi:hypothetical protein